MVENMSVENVSVKNMSVEKMSIEKTSVKKHPGAPIINIWTEKIKISYLYIIFVSN